MSGLPRRPPAAVPALVPPLRRSDCLASRAVSRVLRPPPRVRLRPCRRRVRRGRSPARARLEGARPPHPRCGCCRRARVRALAASGCGWARVRPAGSRARPRERGHHPAERLARELGERWALPVLPVLGRTRPLPRQRGLSLADRRRNVAGAFAPARRAPAALVLVDDVYTSGSTVGAAATALRKGGARRVDVVTFARVVR